MSDSSTPSGWYPDPLGRHDHRWFNGTAWTSDVSDDGRRLVDPFGTAPGGRPGYPDQQRGNGLATASMACGIVGLLLAWIPFIVFVGIVLAVLAIVFGITGLRRADAAGRGRGSAITGLVTGILAMAGAVAGIYLTVITWRAVTAFIEPGRVTTEVIECDIDGRDVSVSGELTNESRTERDYTVFVTVDDRTEVVSLTEVAPDGTVAWDVELRTRTIVTDCDPDVVVQGPFPFGIEIDPVEG